MSETYDFTGCSERERALFELVKSFCDWSNKTGSRGHAVDKMESALSAYAVPERVAVPMKTWGDFIVGKKVHISVYEPYVLVDGTDDTACSLTTYNAIRELHMRVK